MALRFSESDAALIILRDSLKYMRPEDFKSFVDMCMQFLPESLIKEISDRINVPDVKTSPSERHRRTDWSLLVQNMCQEKRITDYFGYKSPSICSEVYSQMKEDSTKVGPDRLPPHGIRLTFSSGYNHLKTQDTASDDFSPEDLMKLGSYVINGTPDTVDEIPGLNVDVQMACNNMMVIDIRVPHHPMLLIHAAAQFGYSLKYGTTDLRHLLTQITCRHRDDSKEFLLTVSAVVMDFATNNDDIVLCDVLNTAVQTASGFQIKRKNGINWKEEAKRIVKLKDVQGMPKVVLDLMSECKFIKPADADMRAWSDPSEYEFVHFLEGVKSICLVLHSRAGAMVFQRQIRHCEEPVESFEPIYKLKGNTPPLSDLCKEDLYYNEGKALWEDTEDELKILLELIERSSTACAVDICDKIIVGVERLARIRRAVSMDQRDWMKDLEKNRPSVLDCTAYEGTYLMDLTHQLEPGTEATFWKDAEIEYRLELELRVRNVLTDMRRIGDYNDVPDNVDLNLVPKLRIVLHSILVWRGYLDKYSDAVREAGTYKLRCASVRDIAAQFLTAVRLDAPYKVPRTVTVTKRLMYRGYYPAGDFIPNDECFDDYKHCVRIKAMMAEDEEKLKQASSSALNPRRQLSFAKDSKGKGVSMWKPRVELASGHTQGGAAVRQQRQEDRSGGGGSSSGAGQKRKVPKERGEGGCPQDSGDEDDEEELPRSTSPPRHMASKERKMETRAWLNNCIESGGDAVSFTYYRFSHPESGYKMAFEPKMGTASEHGFPRLPFKGRAGDLTLGKPFPEFADYQLRKIHANVSKKIPGKVYAAGVDNNKVCVLYGVRPKSFNVWMTVYDSRDLDIIFREHEILTEVVERTHTILERSTVRDFDVCPNATPLADIEFISSNKKRVFNFTWLHSRVLAGRGRMYMLNDVNDTTEEHAMAWLTALLHNIMPKKPLPVTSVEMKEYPQYTTWTPRMTKEEYLEAKREEKYIKDSESLMAKSAAGAREMADTQNFYDLYAKEYMDLMDPRTVQPLTSRMWNRWVVTPRYDFTRLDDQKAPWKIVIQEFDNLDAIMDHDEKSDDSDSTPAPERWTDVLPAPKGRRGTAPAQRVVPPKHFRQGLRSECRRRRTQYQPVGLDKNVEQRKQDFVTEEAIRLSRKRAKKANAELRAQGGSSHTVRSALFVQECESEAEQLFVATENSRATGGAYGDMFEDDYKTPDEESGYEYKTDFDIDDSAEDESDQEGGAGGAGGAGGRANPKVGKKRLVTDTRIILQEEGENTKVLKLRKVKFSKPYDPYAKRVKQMREAKKQRAKQAESARPARVHAPMAAGGDGGAADCDGSSDASMEY